MKKNWLLLICMLALSAIMVACAAPAEEPAEEEPAEEEAAEEEAMDEEMEEEDMAEEDMADEEMDEEAMDEEMEEDAEAAGDEEYVIATVVKLTGVGWFDRMEEGVNQFNEENPNVTAFQQGPAEADAAQQVAVIEDLIAQDVDALAVVPFQPESVEPVLAEAREQGIVVITHEASNQENTDLDIEAFDNQSYGIHLMDALAACMEEEGKYTVFVGSLTSQTHNEWVDAAIAHQEENYPNMELVGDKNESNDDAQQAYEAMQEVLVAHPDIKGMQGSSANDVVGAGQAIEEAGLADDTCVMGTSLPSMAGALLESGAVDLISFWDPALAGIAMNQLALMVLNGEMPEEGMDLGLEGYESISSPDGKVWFGSAWVDVTAENLDDWNF